MDNIKSEINIIDGSKMNSYNCVKAIKTLKHEDYCCPFCSHGETIELKIYREYRGKILGFYFKAYLECSEKCMSVGLYEQIDKERNLPSKEEVLGRALDQFKELIIYSKDRIEFVSV